MAYGILLPEFWDSETVSACSVDARLLAAFLVTGRAAVSVPGLINLGVAGLAEAVRMDYEVTRRALAELVSVGFCEVDEPRRLIRVPNAPRYSPPGSLNVLRAWHRRWQGMPRSPLRSRHVESVRAAIERREMFLAIFEETFGSEDLEPSALPSSMASGGQASCQEPCSRHGSVCSVQCAVSVSSPERGDARGERAPKAKRSKPEPSPEALSLSAYLLEAIRSHTPDHRGDPNGWAVDIDALLRIDHADPERVTVAIDYAHRSSDPFWRPNVLSGKKLRKHFEALRVKASQPARASPVVGHVKVTGNEVYAGREVKL